MTTNDATLNTGTFSTHVNLGEESVLAQATLSYSAEEKDIMVSLLIENMTVGNSVSFRMISNADPEFSERIRQAIIDSCPESFKQNPEALSFHPQVVFPEEIYTIVNKILAE